MCIFKTFLEDDAVAAAAAAAAGSETRFENPWLDQGVQV